MDSKPISCFHLGGYFQVDGFPYAHLVTDRFHVQKLAHDAVQEIRIKYRWEALDQESKQIAEAKEQKVTYIPEVLSNGDTLKQLLARSRYLLFKHHSKWTASQKKRAELLFDRYPELKKAYDLAIRLGDIFRQCKTREHAFKSWLCGTMKLVVRQ